MSPPGPSGPRGDGATKPQKKDACFQQASFFWAGSVKTDILTVTEKTAAQRRNPTASPAQRVAVGSEEQQNERAMSFAMK